MGTGNTESVLGLRTLLQLVSGEHCQRFSYYLLANLKRITWIFTSFFNLTLYHIYGEVLSHLFYSPLITPHYIFFWSRENSQDVIAGWHEWVPTVLRDLLKDLFFA